jgi:predicted transcriptional regulator
MPNWVVTLSMVRFHSSVLRDDHLQELLTEAHSLDREMLLIMRQAIAESLAREEVSRPTASEPSRAHQEAHAELRSASPSRKPNFFLTRDLGDFP